MRRRPISKRRVSHFASNHHYYSDGLLGRALRTRIAPVAKALNLGVTAWLALANGVLTGKYHGHGPSEPGRMSNETLGPFLPAQPGSERIGAAVKTVSDEIGRRRAQTALAWRRDRPVPVIPSIGARKRSRLQDKRARFNLTLSPA